MGRWLNSIAGGSSTPEDFSNHVRWYEIYRKLEQEDRTTLLKVKNTPGDKAMILEAASALRLKDLGLITLAEPDSLRHEPLATLTDEGRGVVEFCIDLGQWDK